MNDMHNIDSEEFRVRLAGMVGWTFPVGLPSGLYLVAWVNHEGGVSAMHDNGICYEAAAAMAAELNEESSPSGDFDEIASAFELRARLAECLRGKMPPESLDAAVRSLERVKPWERCHQPPEPREECPSF